MKDKINDLRKVIIKANPSLLELSFGCVLLRTDCTPPSEYDVITDAGFANNKDKVWVATKVHGSMPVDVDEIGKEENQWKIIGHPITLEHVLVAMSVSKIKPLYTIDYYGMFWKGSKVTDPLIDYNLTKPLNNQSEETINFLHNILCKKKKE